MRDIQVPGAGNGGQKPASRGVVNAGTGVRPIIPAEQAKRYVAPPQPIKREYFEAKKPSSNKKFLALGLFLSLILISVIFFLATFAFDGATITIKPLTRNDVGLNETFIVSELDRKDLLLTKNINVVENITVPKKSIKKVFKKAEGNLTIYNNFSATPQKFIKGTRLETTDGKIFKLTDNIVVPGKSGTDAGKITAHVQADVEGVAYNIGPTKFTIPGLKASPKFKDFYADSAVTMAGGASGDLTSVSDLDLQKASSDIKIKLIENVQNQIGTSAPDGFVFNKDTLVLVTGKMIKTSEDDASATYTENATGTTLFFKRDEIVKRILEKQFSNDTAKPVVKVLDTSKLVIGVSDTNNALNSNSQVTLTVTGPAPAIFYPNKQTILEYYAGRPVSEFNDITKQFQFIESAKRVIYPFWNTRFPTNIAKITVNFDDGN